MPALPQGAVFRNRRKVAQNDPNFSLKLDIKSKTPLEAILTHIRSLHMLFVSFYGFPYPAYHAGYEMFKFLEFRAAWVELTQLTITNVVGSLSTAF